MTQGSNCYILLVIICNPGCEAPEVTNFPQPDVGISEDMGGTDMADPSLAYNAHPMTGEEETEEREMPVDFDRQWKLVNDNPQDFNSWTDLLQYCEQEVRRTCAVE